MNSPWGLLFQIVKETGWSWHSVLWKVNRANLLLMLADRSNFKEQKDIAVEQTGKDLLNRRKKNN